LQWQEWEIVVERKNDHHHPIVVDEGAYHLPSLRFSKNTNLRFINQLIISIHALLYCYNMLLVYGMLSTSPETK
jgi:hypothetical protein